jgi:hypothetical protein
MKKIIYLFTLLFIGNLFAQEESLEKQFKLEFNFISTGISYEIPINKKFLLDISAGVGGGYRFNDGFSAEWIFNSPLAAFGKTELKYYYNRSKREKKGKINLNNSGNYIAFQTKYNSRRFSIANDSSIEPLNSVLLNEIHWGLQRSLGTNWLFNFHLGFGLARDFDFSKNSIYPALGLKFSYKLF